MVKGVTPGFGSQTGVWKEYILRKFVDMLEPNLVFGRFAEPAQIPKGAGAYIASWNIPVKQVSQDLTALTETTAGDNEITGTTITEVTAAIKSYGEWFKVTEIAKISNLSVTLDSYSEQMAQSGADAIDRLLRAQAVATTNFTHAGDLATAGVTLTTSDTLTAQDLAFVSQFFRGKDAKGFKELNGDFMLAIHPDAELDLITDVTTTRLSWSEVNKHVPAGYEQLVNNHMFVGRLNGTTALRTTNVENTVVEDVTSYRNVALARWGIGNCGIGRTGPTKPEIKMKSPGPNDTYQPLDTYNTLGWKVKMAPKLLDASRALIVYSAV